MIKKARLYWNTIKHLRPIQIKGQIQRRLKRKRKNYVMSREPNMIHISIPELDEDEEYLNRFDTDALMREEILLLHEEHELDCSWNEPMASHLWNYNLHYLEFLVPLAVKYKSTGDDKYKNKWIEIINSWMENADAKDAYEPYTISLRIPNVLIGMELLGIEDKNIYSSLYNQYKHLQQNLEEALLANHYFENLKTIVISAIIFNELDVYHKTFDLFLKQIDEQILPDGIHYERSLMYHKIILEDILRVYTVLQSASRTLDADKLLPTVKIMAEVISSLEQGFERTPLFNDAGNNVSKNTRALLKTCERLAGCIDNTKTEFPDSGYYRLDQENYTVLLDCGDIGPRYMGGHAHNDCLSFEMAVEGKVIFSNSGTGQYQGEWRSFFRGTSAHNTIMVDDREQSELWGEHRVGRRVSGIKAERVREVLIGQFQSYQGDRFRRRLEWKKSTLEILDEVKSSGSHIARQFLHLMPGYKYERSTESVNVISGNKIIARIKLPTDSDILIHTEGQITTYAADFGKYEKKDVLEVRTLFKDSIQLKIKIEMQ